MANHLWAEQMKFATSLDPARGVVTAEELRRMDAASKWTQKAHEAEYALFKIENGTPGIIGEHGRYKWLTMLYADIGAVLRLCPEAVLGKYIAVTSRDSGSLQLTDEDLNNGWLTSEGGKVFTVNFDGGADRKDRHIAYSPRVVPSRGNPIENLAGYCEGFDEWYVFQEAISPTDMEVFVNSGSFRLYAPEFEAAEPEGHGQRFWTQMECLAPESFFG